MVDRRGQHKVSSDHRRSFFRPSHKPAAGFSAIRSRTSGAFACNWPDRVFRLLGALLRIVFFPHVLQDGKSQAADRSRGDNCTVSFPMDASSLARGDDLPLRSLRTLRVKSFPLDTRFVALLHRASTSHKDVLWVSFESCLVCACPTVKSLGPKPPQLQGLETKQTLSTMELRSRNTSDSSLPLWSPIGSCFGQQ